MLTYKFEIGDLVSITGADVLRKYSLFGDNVATAETLGIILKIYITTEIPKSGMLHGIYDVQWLGPKKKKTRMVRGYLLDKVLTNK